MEVTFMAVLLGMLAGALLVLAAALAAVWVQERRATRADHVGIPNPTTSRPSDRPPTTP
jgi:hypothetical protein